MRVIIYGAGGIGGVIGAQLFEAGHDVVLIARGQHLKAIQENGLIYKTPKKSAVLPVQAVGHPRDITFTPDDVVLLTMKAQHTYGALEDLYAAAGGDVPVICGQNGVANERMALRRFRHVYGMCVILPSDFLEPGTILTHSVQKTGILDSGVYPHGVDERITALTAMLEGSNFSARPVPDVMRHKYAKLRVNLINALLTICPNDDAGLLRLMKDEADAVFKAAGIDCADTGETRGRRKGLMEMGEIEGVPRAGNSSLQGLLRGNVDTEVDFLNGEIVLLGRLHGVPTPANETIQRRANELIRSGGEPQSLSASDLLSEIEAAALKAG